MKATLPAKEVMKLVRLSLIGVKPISFDKKNNICAEIDEEKIRLEKVGGKQLYVSKNTSFIVNKFKKNYTIDEFIIEVQR